MTRSPGLVAEHGGELINTGHVEMRRGVNELRFQLDNLLQGETQGTEPLFSSMASRARRRRWRPISTPSMPGASNRR